MFLQEVRASGVKYIIIIANYYLKAKNALKQNTVSVSYVFFFTNASNN